MYDYIKGTLVKITAKHIVIETNGLGYIVTVANPYSFSDQMNQTIQVYLHQVIRDDAHLLFGFHTEDEKEVFLKLISVSGIGPTTALAIVAVDDNQGLVAAIDNSDIKYLMKFAELPAETTNTTANQTAGNQQLDEAMEALLALGYKATELKKVKAFFEDTNETAEQYIKSALKMLMK